MTNYDLRIKGDRAIREMEREKAQIEEILGGPVSRAGPLQDCVLVQPDPNAHLGGVESE